MAALDTETAEVTALVGSVQAIGTDFTSLEAEVDSLKAQIAAGSVPDTTALDTALANLSSSIQNVAAQASAATAPPAAPVTPAPATPPPAS